MSTIEDMKKKHPDALCFQNCDCPHLNPAKFPNGPCSLWSTKWPRTFCRDGFCFDKRIKPELKE
jgi:hypothetical protein